ncbi:fas-binding factor 1 homolog isoform X2 [Poecilia reticulata]|uniref:Fas binding factor 1 n=1 Tax=Poecilia reticulata TaxID=8081 RepID=A0A3P9PPV7_POERE|nr:PREDICTED: fas-binding factor 1 isoform X2 [Poecilia reticulata]
MPTKPKSKASQNLFEDDDILDSLFNDDSKQPTRSKGARVGRPNVSSPTNSMFSRMAEEVRRDDLESSDVSEADPSDVLKNLKDMDDLEADLFPSRKKPPLQTKSVGNEDPVKDSAVLESNANLEGADEATGGGKKPNTAPSSSAHKYNDFFDLDDPLADSLDDLLPDETRPEPKARQSKPDKSVPPASASSPVLRSQTTKTAKKEDKDDLLDALGFERHKDDPRKKESPLWSSKEKSEAPQRPRTRIQDILDASTSARLPTGERKDEKLQQEKNHSLKDPFVEDDLTFGSYQPTLVTTPEGRQSRRQSVRFSTEDVRVSSPEKKPQPSTPPTSRHRNSAEWLGLTANDELDDLEEGSKAVKSSAPSPKVPSSPVVERKSSLAGNQAASVARMTEDAPNFKQSRSEVSKGKMKDEEEEYDWLEGALSRKKALSEAKAPKQGESLQIESVVSNQDKAAPFRDREETVTSIGDTSPVAHSTPIREEKPSQEGINSSSYQSALTVNTDSPTVQCPVPSSPAAPPLHHTLSSSHSPDRPPRVASLVVDSSVGNSHPLSQFSQLASNERSDMPRKPTSGESLQKPGLPGPSSAALPASPQRNPTKGTSSTVQQQVSFTADNLQQLLLQQQMMQTQLLGLGSAADTGALQRLKEKEQQHGECQALQARIIQLEGEVKMLQLERDQSQMILENIQHRHKQNMQLLENTHKTRVKLLEESAAQRETRARLECEELMERLATLTRSAEQERSELQAQYHRKLAQAQQDRDREVERLRDLQRKSILEMKKDHEEQLQRLKRLKDEEIDAVTSATSQTRSLTGVIEQMEQFSSRLGELSSRVESTHEHTAHGLEQGARHRDEQLRIMQERLAQQQKAMAEERTYLKEIISRMDSQISEQQRQLEKERWKVTAEQAKAESTQRGLEEERRVFTMQISMEREELERAKSSLLEEQKSVMQHCAEERRKLAAEWAHFHTQEKQRHDKAEREVNSLLERREGSIIGLVQEQADLKLRMAELKQKEMAVTQEKETLARLKEELDREKETASSMALRLKTRAEEVEAFSKLAAEKYEEGERALLEAKRVESDHVTRLRNIQVQTENLRQQEQRILKERMKGKHLQEDTERLREYSTISPLPHIIPPILTDSVPVFPSFPEPTSVRNNPSNPLDNYQSMTLEASLALWKYTAEKDREFLLEEQIFLENLKKKSYKFNADSKTC